MKRMINFLFTLLLISIPIGCSSSNNDESNYPPGEIDNTFKVMSYNILNGMKNDNSPNKTTYVNWLKAKDIDILALQEINFVEGLPTSTKIDEEAELKKQANRYGHNHVVILKKPGYKNHIGITSKYPIEDVVKVHEGMDHGYIKAKINGYNILATHLDPYAYENRQREIQLVLNEIKKSGEQNWILLGDFNSVTPLDEEKYLNDGNRYLDWLKKYENDGIHHNLVDGKIDYSIHQAILDFGLKDALYEINPDYSYPKDRAARIDFIYVSENLLKKTVKYQVIEDAFTKKVSDHYPHLIELKRN